MFFFRKIILSQTFKLEIEFVGYETLLRVKLQWLYVEDSKFSL